MRQHERARKLHFTTYGWSTLSYGHATLHTSTVQMLILLQFNRSKVREREGGGKKERGREREVGKERGRGRETENGEGKLLRLLFKVAVLHSIVSSQ